LGNHEDCSQRLQGIDCRRHVTVPREEGCDHSQTQDGSTKGRNDAEAARGGCEGRVDKEAARSRTEGRYDEETASRRRKGTRHSAVAFGDIHHRAGGVGVRACGRAADSWCGDQRSIAG
jgi:hypothetical protein